MSRDDFAPSTIQLLAKRVGFKCSSPECRKPTSGPGAELAAVNLGVAAHITAAAPSGARFNPALTNEARSSYDNGIWLCQQCSRLVDADDSGHSVETLRDWKGFAEAAAFVELRGYDVVQGRSFSALECKLPKLVVEMRADLQKKPFTREFVILKRSWSYNYGPKPCFSYYFDDHEDILSQMQICEHYGAIYDVKFNNIDRYNFSEDFADYSLGNVE